MNHARKEWEREREREMEEKEKDGRDDRLPLKKVGKQGVRRNVLDLF